MGQDGAGGTPAPPSAAPPSSGPPAPRARPRPLGPEAVRSVERDRREYREALESAAGRVRPVLRAIRQEGDAALQRLEREMDGWSGALRVPREAWDRADARTPAPVRQALALATERVRAFHAAQHPASIERSLPGGTKLSLRFRPLLRVGVHVPSGRFPSPSTVLMTAVPAKAAGVAEVFLATAPRKEEKDGIAPAVATAARLAGVDRIYLLGGAVAVGAFAYGTPSVPRVDKIVGPGDRYFTAAKREVLGEVGVDALSGPSESVLVFDRSTPFELVVRETLAQAERGADARVRVVALGGGLADAFGRWLEAAVPSPRVLEQVEVWIARDLAEARRYVEAVAPETLVVSVEDGTSWERDPPPCGSLFLGAWSAVAYSDYVSGVNRILPVEGSARFQSGITAYEFGRWTAAHRVTRADAEAMAVHGAALAEAEGMPAHAEAMRARTRPLPANPTYAPALPTPPGAGPSPSPGSAPRRERRRRGPRSG